MCKFELNGEEDLELFGIVLQGNTEKPQTVL